MSLQKPNKMCEGCGLKQVFDPMFGTIEAPRYGLASEGKARWCSGCGWVEGAVLITSPRKRKTRLDKWPRDTASATAGAGAKQGTRSVRAWEVFGGNDTDSDGDEAPRAEEKAVAGQREGAHEAVAEDVEVGPAPALEPTIKWEPSDS